MSKNLYISTILKSRLDSVFESIGGSILKAGYDRGIYFIEANKTFNSTIDKPITLGKEGGIFIRGTEQYIKLTSLIKEVYGITDPLKLEEYATKWKRLYEVSITDVKVSADPVAVYSLYHTPSGTIGSSCMRHNSGYYESISHACDVAYIVDNDDSLVARALLWNCITEAGSKLKLMDRVYYAKEIHKITMEKWAEANGYWRKDKQEAGVTKYRSPNNTLAELRVEVDAVVHFSKEDRVPYMDTMYLWDTTDSRLRNYRVDGNEVYYLQSTEGIVEDYSEGNYTCGDCECSCREDEIYSTYYDALVCHECLDNYYVYASDVETYIFAEDAYYTVDTHNYFKDYDYLYYAEDTGDYYETVGDLYYVEDLSCYYVYDDDLICTEDTGFYYTTEWAEKRFYKDSDGYYYEDEDEIPEDKRIKEEGEDDEE